MIKDNRKDKEERDKNKDVKDQILAAAKKMFSSRGYEGTTVRDICTEAGVSLALVSYHFGGKEKVFFALFDPIRRSFVGDAPDLSDGLSELKAFSREFVVFRHEERELIDILQQELLLHSPRLEMLRDVFLPAWERMRLILLACKDQGSVAFEALDVALNFVMGTLIFSLNNSFLNPRETDLSPDEAADYAIGYILNGIGKI